MPIIANKEIDTLTHAELVELNVANGRHLDHNIAAPGEIATLEYMGRLVDDVRLHEAIARKSR